MKGTVVTRGERVTLKKVLEDLAREGGQAGEERSDSSQAGEVRSDSEEEQSDSSQPPATSEEPIMLVASESDDCVEVPVTPIIHEPLAYFDFT